MTQRRRTTVLLMGATLVLALVATWLVASTKESFAQGTTITCPEGSETVSKNEKGNKVLDADGDQCYLLKAGNDAFDNPGTQEEADTDVVFAGKGNDIVDLRDGDADDSVSCGAGDKDVAIIDAILVYGEATTSGSDTVADDCETVYESVVVSGYPTPPPPPPPVAAPTSEPTA